MQFDNGIVIFFVEETPCTLAKGQLRMEKAAAVVRVTAWYAAATYSNTASSDEGEKHS